MADISKNMFLFPLEQFINHPCCWQVLRRRAFVRMYSKTLKIKGETDVYKKNMGWLQRLEKRLFYSPSRCRQPGQWSLLKRFGSALKQSEGIFQSILRTCNVQKWGSDTRTWLIPGFQQAVWNVLVMCAFQISKCHRIQATQWSLKSNEIIVWEMTIFSTYTRLHYFHLEHRKPAAFRPESSSVGVLVPLWEKSFQVWPPGD